MTLTYKNILIAVDGSNEAELAFQRAIQVAINNKGAKLYIVHVIDTRSFAMYESYDQSISKRIVELAEDMLSEFENKALQAGVPEIHKIIEYGSPKQMIVKEIPKKYDIDLIICGISGMGGVERFLLGSVSEGIVRYAPCDVLVVRNM